MPLYGVDRLGDVAQVVVTEGEPATNALLGIGIPAVGTVTGAGTIPSDDSLAPLIPLNVVLWADADADADGVGELHMARIAGRLLSLGCQSVRLVEWVAAPEKGDAVNAISQRCDIASLLAEAKPVRNPREEHIADLLGEVVTFIRRYVIMTYEQAVAATFWVAHTHAFEAAGATLYLSVNSPEKRSGKTRLLEVLELVVANPWMTSRTSPAALYRKIDAEGCTLLLDESDAAFRGPKENGKALRGVLDAGH